MNEVPCWLNETLLDEILAQPVINLDEGQLDFYKNYEATIQILIKDPNDSTALATFRNMYSLGLSKSWLGKITDPKKQKWLKE